jgi:hypothetical protein
MYASWSTVAAPTFGSPEIAELINSAPDTPGPNSAIDVLIEVPFQLQ